MERWSFHPILQRRFSADLCLSANNLLTGPAFGSQDEVPIIFKVVFRGPTIPPFLFRSPQRSPGPPDPNNQRLIYMRASPGGFLFADRYLVLLIKEICFPNPALFVGLEGAANQQVKVGPISPPKPGPFLK